MNLTKSARKFVKRGLQKTNTERFYVKLSDRKAPDFLIIGAMKSGTTSLFHYLRNHSQIASADVKELYFFSFNYKYGVVSYLKHFPYKKHIDSKLVFEASATYLHDPESALKIKKVLPSAKLICVLRDPIERAISHFNFYSNKSSAFVLENPLDYEQRSIEEAFEDDLEGREERMIFKYCNFGLYGKQLKKYYDNFNPDNLLVIDFDELKTDPKGTLMEVADFLNINPEEFKNYNTKAKKIDTNQSSKFSSDNSLHIYNSMDYNLNISKTLKEKLVGFYRDDISLLKDITHRDFSWSKKYMAG